MKPNSVYTIGFTKTSAERFFERLKKAGVKRVIDVRLHNVSQLSGFAKSDDLKFFLRNLIGADYTHMPVLAPTDDMLSEYRGKSGSWDVYERKFRALMRERGISTSVPPELFQDACLLCSEDKPHHCHRRLVAEYLNEQWHSGLTIRHL